MRPKRDREKITITQYEQKDSQAKTKLLKCKSKTLSNQPAAHKQDLLQRIDHTVKNKPTTNQFLVCPFFCFIIHIINIIHYVITNPDPSFYQSKHYSVVVILDVKTLRSLHRDSFIHPFFTIVDDGDMVHIHTHSELALNDSKTSFCLTHFIDNFLRFSYYRLLGKQSTIPCSFQGPKCK